jgi:hypothetical protein
VWPGLCAHGLFCCSIRSLQRLVTRSRDDRDGAFGARPHPRSRLKPRRTAHRGFLICKARWQSGHAAACKAVYAGSIPTLASNCHLPKVLEFRGFVLETCRCSGLSRSSQTGSNRLVPARLGGNATSQSAHKPLQTRGDHRRSLHSCINPFLWRCRCPFTSDPAARAVPSNCV